MCNLEEMFQPRVEGLYVVSAVYSRIRRPPTAAWAVGRVVTSGDVVCGVALSPT